MNRQAIRLASWIMTGILVMGLFFQTGRMVFAQQAAAVAAASRSESKIEPVNINKANLEELQVVRGIGPALAERIIQYRTANGNFETLEQLSEVRGIGEAKFEKMKSQITI
ncbi:MAG: hypothetical protein A3G33_08895 [Omnitrophica bacterium RIFCSPLOWO2_12_FULL_44_17]|uniref:Helix-hairpin-helix DNA-binding motif class 1 domain-containing protein n=1 Tax=Candidatus Danuiimicrobium aquiferis TaxID=1801832 RepID=A0A1G1L1A8_9BACT|nr:MAG: hypothetical protein A3B72_08235 [Omnitrophica bacterium RIFCSPHIGHO2_02_FULL_45_28]OGW88183.1 MAG: hypothetical protein A3E74_05875 [Omnitrophica bacterium RIFCSPHIGHO2_12_FULL_44_12]OGW98940.1 MAG: hypothetical protein A3G33_08895 [Omnitrophica bacterium RIFCSPLOWO2_12_FULL_44_17]OGX02033.1 MAG: hypothetical protein A3J12_03660 [Omnitrophica bacterium RIFCSPLOWO2_02_FULL_44_11]